MTIETMMPFVRYAHKITQFIPAGVMGCDHRVFYCVCGTAEILAGTEPKQLCAGAFLYIPAGIPYRALNTSEDFAAIALNFDFGQTQSSTFAALPPVYAEKSASFSPIEKQAPPSEFSLPLLVLDLAEGERYMRDIEHEYRHKKLYAEKCTSLLLSSLLILVLRRAASHATPRFSKLAQDVAAYLRAHHREPCTNKELGEIFSYHPNYLNRLMVAYTGLSLHKYLTRTRIDRAIDLLSTTTMTVGEVGRAVGFPDPSHFSKAFEQVTGHPPSAFRA